MFRKAYRLPFTLLGIPVLLDFTFLIILPVFAFSIAGRVDYWARAVGVADHSSLHAPWMPYLLGFITAIGLFTSVLVHELGHSVVARLYGVKVRSITLWLLGGVAAFEDMPRQRGAEAVVAIVGPLVSIAVGALCWLVVRALPPSAVPAAFVFTYLAFMNGSLAVFNMIPALPLDGGRVLRSLLALRMPHFRATQVAAHVSRVLAVALGLYGLYTLSFMLVLVALFVFMAVKRELIGSMMTGLLEGARVGDLMSRRVVAVPAGASVEELAQLMASESEQVFAVIDGDHVVGMVYPEDLRRGSVPPDARVADVMRPQVHAVRDDAPAADAMQGMGTNGFQQLLVVDATGRLVGTLTRTDLLRAIEMRRVGLGVAAEPANGAPPPGVIEPPPLVGGRS
jgi:Zn-dependent protease